jgi:hypothetical protein
MNRSAWKEALGQKNKASGQKPVVILALSRIGGNEQVKQYNRSIGKYQRKI